VSDVAGLAARPAPEPRAVLRAAGVAAPEAIDAARLHDLSRSHALTFAELPDGSAYVVKRVLRRPHDAGRSLAAELYAYRLASWHPDLASVLPTPVHLDERREVIALVAAPPEHLYPAQCLEPGFPSPDLAAALGRALATLHAATRGIPLLTVAACGVVALPDAPEDERRLGADSAAALAITRDVLADAALVAALRRAAAALRPTCLIHADVKWDNALIDPGPPARVGLFDWELSGRGDPAWDVGSALADTVSLAARLHGLSALPSDPAQWLSPALRALLVAYADRADTGASAELAATVAGSWTARTIHLALECAASADAPDHPVVRELLAAARLLAGRHDDVAAAVHGTLAGAA
jgi:aminoglycoside phosphotransferase (APT) family kinase protein